MMTWTHFLLAAGLVAACHGSYDDYRAWLSKAASNVTIQRDFNKHLHLFKDDTQDYGTPAFPCTPTPRSDVSPTSVHRLTPADVQVVAALGDSITAGTGITACTIIGLLWQDRGLSWSIGGDGDYNYQPTIPNIVRKFNPNVKGFSVKSGSARSRNAHLDVAVPGAKSEDMVEQAESLVERLKSEPGVDFKNDWKVITIFIGGNDLCDYCDDKGRYNASNYVQRVQKALDILHAGIPRAFVNLVEVNHVDEMKKLNIGLVCSVAHLFICRCAAYPGSEEASQQLHRATEDYDTALEKLVASGRYDDRDDFTVVLQPFFKDTMLPLKDGKPDLTFFSPDCFHFSRRAHAAAAIALWNNMVVYLMAPPLVSTVKIQDRTGLQQPMLVVRGDERNLVIEPVGEKRRSWSPGQSPNCPTRTTHTCSQTKTATTEALSKLDLGCRCASTLDIDYSNRIRLGSCTATRAGRYVCSDGTLCKRQ